MKQLTNETRQNLIDLANEARKKAYSPYSNYPVGAALLAKNGKIYTGANVENAAFSVTMCAERVALFKAVSEGEREFDVIAVVTDNGGSPCGPCRQALSEFGGEINVLIANRNGKLTEETTIEDLLPGAFGPEHLP